MNLNICSKKIFNEPVVPADAEAVASEKEVYNAVPVGSVRTVAELEISVSKNCEIVISVSTNDEQAV